MTRAPLAPLSLDDIRIAGPDRDNDGAFDPEATWANACALVEIGHPAATVAGLLLELSNHELGDVRQFCPVHPDDIDAADAISPEVALCRALGQIDGLRQWIPTISVASVYDLLDQRDRALALLRHFAAPEGTGYADATGDAHALLLAATGKGLFPPLTPDP